MNSSVVRFCKVLNDTIIFVVVRQQWLGIHFQSQFSYDSYSADQCLGLSHFVPSPVHVSAFLRWRRYREVAVQ